MTKDKDLGRYPLKMLFKKIELHLSDKKDTKPTRGEVGKDSNTGEQDKNKATKDHNKTNM